MQASSEKKPALFLDRDGVVNIEKNYLHKKEDFEFIDGIFDVCRYYEQKGFQLFVVTNQSGIARGYYTEDDFSKLTHWMTEAFASEGIYITKVYHCPHHPEHSGACECRKPKPGMLLQAEHDFGVDFAHSIMIGDSERDIEAAHAVGIKKTYLFTANEKPTKAMKNIHQLIEAIE